MKTIHSRGTLLINSYESGMVCTHLKCSGTVVHLILDFVRTRIKDRRRDTWVPAVCSEVETKPGTLAPSWPLERQEYPSLSAMLRRPLLEDSPSACRQRGLESVWFDIGKHSACAACSSANISIISVFACIMDMFAHSRIYLTPTPTKQQRVERKRA